MTKTYQNSSCLESAQSFLTGSFALKSKLYKDLQWLH